MEDGYYCQNLDPCWGGWWQEAGYTGMKRIGEDRKLHVCICKGPGQLPGQGCQQREHPGKAAPPEDWAEAPGWQETYRDFVPMGKKDPSLGGGAHPVHPRLHPVLQRGPQGGPRPCRSPTIYSLQSSSSNLGTLFPRGALHIFLLKKRQ